MSSPVLELLGKVRPQISNNPHPQEIVPHVYSFSSLINTATRVYSYRYDEALRHLPGNALAMRRDAFIEALLQERFLPTSQRNWSIKVPDPKDPDQAWVAKCVTSCIRAIPRFDAMRYYLMEAAWYGRHGAQLELVQRRIGGGTYWTVGHHRPVNGDKIHYDWDGTPEVAINPLTAGAYPLDLTRRSDRGMYLLKLKRPEHRRQFVIHRHIVNDADYFEPEMGGGIHGVGLRSKIYWAWWLRDEMLSWAADFMQKVGTLGLLIFMYEDGNANSLAKAEAAASKASTEVALTLAMPPGQNTRPANAVQHIPPSDGGVMALRGMIEDYFERHIERMIVGQPSTGGVEGNGFGGSAGAALHADTKFQILKWDAGNLDETLTCDLVGMITCLNHGELDFPVQFKSSVPNPEDAAKLQAVKTGVDMGISFDEDEVRELTGMSAPEHEDRTIGGKEQLEANRQAKADQLNALNGNKDATKDNSTKPAGDVTTNDGLKRETGKYSWAELAAFADDGSVFDKYVEADGGKYVTLGAKRNGSAAVFGGNPVLIKGHRIVKGHPDVPVMNYPEHMPPARQLAVDIELHQAAFSGWRDPMPEVICQKIAEEFLTKTEG